MGLVGNLVSLAIMLVPVILFIWLLIEIIRWIRRH